MMGDGGADYGNWAFTTRRGWARQLAEWAMAAVPSSPTLGINGCLKVTVTPDLLRVAATDQQLTVIAETPTVESKAGGEAFIPAKRLREILASAPDGDVTVAVKGGSAKVTAGQASWTLRLPPAKGYIGLPDLTGAEFRPADREGLLQGLQAVRHAVCRDLGRPEFTQVRIAGEAGAMRAAASDSQQFASAVVPGFPFPVSIPLTGLDDLLKVLSKSPEGETVEAAETASCVVFRIGRVTLAATRTTRVFPDVDAMFLRPVAGHDRRLAVDKADLAAALRRARVNANPRTSAVALTASGAGGKPTLTVAARDKDGNSSEEVIAAADWSALAGGEWLPSQEAQQAVVHAGFLEAMIAVNPSAALQFRLGRERGAFGQPLLLEDTEGGVLGTIPQMPPGEHRY